MPNIKNINKISKDIKIEKNRIGKIFFKSGDQSVNLIEKLVLSSFRKLNKFYKIDNIGINLRLLYSREEFDKKMGRKTPEWMVGVILKNTIYLFSPSVIEKFSTHKKSRLNKIIAHELCHIFNDKINKEILNWIDEGTALFLAGQEKAKDFKKTDWQFFIDNFLDRNISLQSFAEHEGYKISYWTIRTIAEKFGINKLLDLIKINPKEDNVEGKLEEMLGVPVDNLIKILAFSLENKLPPLQK